MELIKKNIRMEHRLNPTFVQISLEEDQNITDQKPDALKIICKKAEVNIGETKVLEEYLLVKGSLTYGILYLTDEAEKRLCCMEGEIPFEEKIYTVHTGSNGEIRVVASAEDLMIRLINSRKINIRCIIGASIMQDVLYEEETVVDVEDPNACEVLKKKIDFTTIVLDTKDIYRIKDEITIPDGYPNIYSMVWKDMSINALEFIPMDGRVGIRGEYKLFIMYEGDEEEATPKYFETVRPIDGMIEVPECMENMILCMDTEKGSPQIEIRSDYDGEDRVLGIDMEMKLFIKLYRNETISVVADAYGIQEELEPIMKEGNCEYIIKNENGKIRVGDVRENEDKPIGDLQILHVDGCILDEKVNVKEGEITITGVVHMEILCVQEDENEPYRCITADLPYSHPVAVPGMQKDDPCYAKTVLEQFHAGVQGNKIDLRGLLAYRLLAYRQTKEPMLAGMEKVSSENQEGTLPVMSVYFARENECLWDIGKKYRVSLNRIREGNEIKSDIMQGGERIMIAKEII